MIRAEPSTNITKQSLRRFIFEQWHFFGTERVPISVSHIELGTRWTPKLNKLTKQKKSGWVQSSNILLRSTNIMMVK